MAVYRSILLAIDLHPECDEVTAKRALELAKSSGAKLNVIHAVEHINAYGVAQAYPTVIDLEEQMLKEAQDGLAKFGTLYSIPVEQQAVVIGSPKNVILQRAQEVNADLIIVGSHGRHGISLLLGSTANAILHHAHCDVLAVWINDHAHKTV